MIIIGRELSCSVSSKISDVQILLLVVCHGCEFIILLMYVQMTVELDSRIKVQAERRAQLHHALSISLATNLRTRSANPLGYVPLTELSLVDASKIYARDVNKRNSVRYGNQGSGKHQQVPIIYEKQ